MICCDSTVFTRRLHHLCPDARIFQPSSMSSLVVFDFETSGLKPSQGARIIEIGAVLVEEGLAWAFTRYSVDYVEAEAVARQAHIGIWQGDYEAPWDYRARKWAEAAQAAPEGCPIKGNISSGGKIYHPPWSPWYGKTRINTSKGERWFCSEDEAIAAGWRAPVWR